MRRKLLPEVEAITNTVKFSHLKRTKAPSQLANLALETNQVHQVLQGPAPA